MFQLIKFESPMTKNLYLVLLLAACSFCVVNAQEEESMSASSSTMVTTGYPDEMTVDAEQNKAWRMGEHKYSAKPKNAWEVGLHLGHFFIDGDVDRTIPGGYGLGLHLRKALHYAFSLRGDFFYGQATGLDPQPWRHRTVPGANGIGGGLVEDTFNPYANNDQGWFPSHKTRYMYLALQGVLNIGNILFHNDRNKWNWYMTLGAGFDNHKTMLDLLDADGNPYRNLVDDSGYTVERFNTKSGRSDIKSALNDIYDGDYETEGYKKKGIFRLGDETNIHVVFTGSMGVARKINKRFNIGLEHQIMVTDNDYLDGIKFRTADDQTNNVDIGHYTNVRLAINLGNFDKVTEPLYWLNPLDATFNDIAELKKRPELDLTDEDGDGVVDMLDQELNSPAGCAVDTRGIVLYSDGDGLADCKDAEPYSPPGYTVDSRGVAEVPAIETLNEGDVIRIMNENCPGCKQVKTGCGEWFLPMIHFDLDKYTIKPEFYSQLHHVASVMKMCPELCVVAYGHTDKRNTNDYNKVLSYNRAQAAIDYLVSNYGIDRSRLKLMYGGEENLMIPSGNTEAHHYMNRRVEFKVCDGNSFDMGRPEGPDAGQGGSVIRGSQYNGNKSSGY